MSTFEEATNVQHSEFGYCAELRSDWQIWGPNGGYLSTIALRAAGDLATIKRPSTLHGHYLRAAKPGLVDLEVMSIQRSSRSESIRVRMLQGDKPVFVCLVRTSLATDGLVYDEGLDVEHGAKADPQLLPLFQEQTYGIDFWSHFERRLIHPEYNDSKFRTKFAEFEEWIRFQTGPFDNPFLEAGRSLLLLDTFMFAAVFRRVGDSDYLAPSLDITAFFHQSSAQSEWLRIHTRSPVASGGQVFGEGRVFDQRGSIVATGSSQLICLPNRKDR